MDTSELLDSIARKAKRIRATAVEVAKRSDLSAHTVGPILKGRPKHPPNMRTLQRIEEALDGMTEEIVGSSG